MKYINTSDVYRVFGNGNLLVTSEVLLRPYSISYSGVSFIINNLPYVRINKERELDYSDDGFIITLHADNQIGLLFPLQVSLLILSLTALK